MKKTNTRFIRTVIETAKEVDVTLPFDRNARNSLI